MGVYYELFYGTSGVDKNLILNHPQTIRSDEWLVSSQKTLSQARNGLGENNTSLGNGESQVILSDAPTIGLTTIFKPQNFGFFFLSSDHAFSFRWWSSTVLIILSLYFVTLTIMPGKRLFALLVSLIFTFSPFVQWWFSIGICSIIYFAFFAMLSFMKLISSDRFRSNVLWTTLLTYSSIGFVLVLYPPFQIPVALSIGVFCAMYLIYSSCTREVLVKKLYFMLCAVLTTVLTVGIVLYTQRDLVSALSNSSYPGHRLTESGGYRISGLLSGASQIFLQDPNRGVTNQSETANFFFLFPVLLTVLLWRLVQKYKSNRSIDYVTLGLAGITTVYLFWLFVPGLKLLGVITLLDRVPQQRLMIGFGLIEVLTLIWFIKTQINDRVNFLSNKAVVLVCLGTFVLFTIAHSLVNSDLPPQYIRMREIILLAIPPTIIVYCLCKRYFTVALVLLSLLTLSMVWHIHPLYRGTSVLTDNPVVTAISKTAQAAPSGRWVSDDIYIENFAALAGYPSLSGTYLYPQVDLWSKLLPDSSIENYNRFAHVNFSFDRQPLVSIPPQAKLISNDQFVIEVEPCSDGLRNLGVKFIITAQKIENIAAPCLKQLRIVPTATRTYYIYRIE